jgi:hypothetical protein
MDLVYSAATVHRMYNDPTMVSNPESLSAAPQAAAATHNMHAQQLHQVFAGSKLSELASNPSAV